MRLHSILAAAHTLGLVLAMAAGLNAQDTDEAMDMMAAEPVVQNAGKGCLDCCCDQSAWFFGAEATFFRFHEANGVQDADGDNVEFDFEASPRITLGYVSCDGWGARIRWWEYDHDAIAAGDDVVDVDTYNIDFEIFQEVCLNCCTSVEISAGIRYNEFQFLRENGSVATDLHDFSGVGGMFAIEGRRDLGCGLGVYARLREAIMTGDMVLDGRDEVDVTRPITEIAFGVAYGSCNWNVHAGLEWQNWANYTEGPAFLNLDQEVNDIGFAGFVLGGELTY